MPCINITPITIPSPTHLSWNCLAVDSCSQSTALCQLPPFLFNFSLICEKSILSILFFVLPAFFNAYSKDLQSVDTFMLHPSFLSTISSHRNVLCPLNHLPDLSPFSSPRHLFPSENPPQDVSYVEYLPDLCLGYIVILILKPSNDPEMYERFLPNWWGR